MMRAVNAWWDRGPSFRSLMLVLAAAAAAFAVRWQAAATFSRELGFVPFDLQDRLNQGMLVIQVGAARGHSLGRLYGAFVAADVPVSLVVAFAAVVLWRWLHLKAPNRGYGLLTAGGVMLLPVAVAVLEMSEHRAVFGLLQQRGREGYADAVASVVAIHNVKMALAYLRDALTLIFVAVTAMLALWRRRGRASPE